MTERRDIGSRLENWARVYHDNPRPGLSPTAAFCDQLRREAEGDKSPPERRKVDEEDAAIIERGMRHIDTRHRMLLWWCYIKQAHPGEVCRRMRIDHKPATVFVKAFRDAQDAIASVVEPRNSFHDA